MIGDSVEEKGRAGCFGEYLLSEHKIKAYDVVFIQFLDVKALVSLTHPRMRRFAVET